MIPMVLFLISSHHLVLKSMKNFSMSSKTPIILKPILRPGHSSLTFFARLIKERTMRAPLEHCPRPELLFTENLEHLGVKFYILIGIMPPINVSASSKSKFRLNLYSNLDKQICIYSDL